MSNQLKTVLVFREPCSDILLRIMYGAQEVTPQQAPELSAMVGDLARVDSD